MIRTADGLQFPANENESLLDAALRAGVTLEHSCRTGRCGACKTKVSLGKTVALIDESGLTPDERQSGWVLSCARGADGNVSLEAESLGAWNIEPAKTYPCRIHALERMAPDVLKVTLRLPPQQSFPYRPGQYIDVIGPGGVCRSYSIANAPKPDRLVELHIRRVPGGAMSQYWFETAKQNDLLRFHGPLGTFFLRDAAPVDLVFLATGTGMAPIKAILEALGAQPNPCQGRAIHVFWGGRTLADLYWPPGVLGDWFEFVPVLSKGGAPWDGARGYVQDAVIAANINLTTAAVYACGSAAMIEGARTLLINSGLNPRRFHADAFVSSS